MRRDGKRVRCSHWTDSLLRKSHDRLFDSVSVVLVGKYTALQDSYTSVVKSLEHAALQCGRKLVVTVSWQTFDL